MISIPSISQWSDLLASTKEGRLYLDSHNNIFASSARLKDQQLTLRQIVLVTLQLKQQIIHAIPLQAKTIAAQLSTMSAARERKEKELCWLSKVIVRVVDYVVNFFNGLGFRGISEVASSLSNELNSITPSAIPSHVKPKKTAAKTLPLKPYRSAELKPVASQGVGIKKNKLSEAMSTHIETVVKPNYKITTHKHITEEKTRKVLMPEVRFSKKETLKTYLSSLTPESEKKVATNILYRGLTYISLKEVPNAEWEDPHFDSSVVLEALIKNAIEKEEMDFKNPKVKDILFDSITHTITELQLRLIEWLNASIRLDSSLVATNSDLILTCIKAFNTQFSARIPCDVLAIKKLLHFYFDHKEHLNLKSDNTSVIELFCNLAQLYPNDNEVICLVERLIDQKEYSYQTFNELLRVINEKEKAHHVGEILYPLRDKLLASAKNHPEWLKR